MRPSADPSFTELVARVCTAAATCAGVPLLEFVDPDSKGLARWRKAACWHARRLNVPNRVIGVFMGMTATRISYMVREVNHHLATPADSDGHWATCEAVDAIELRLYPRHRHSRPGQP